MKQDASPIRCADAIAKYGERYVMIERLTTPRGLALPGGKIDPGESALTAVCREFHEETGLTLTVYRQVGVYDSPGRDPRGPYVSEVFHGVASGSVREEAGKTRVLLLTREEIMARLGEFVADHAKILAEFFQRSHP